MDYTEQFHLFVKDGNRLGRRLRKLGGTLGGRGGRGGGAGRIGSIREPFDPNAFDGDGDGLIQDSSPWERPAAVSAQTISSTVSAEAELIDPKERESATSVGETRPAKNRKERRAQRASSPATVDTPSVDTPLRELIAEPDLYEEDIDVFVPTPPVLLEEGVSGISVDEQRRRELDKRDNRLPNKTIDMTPDELALMAVPLDDDGENSADAIAGHPSQYPTPADAATARNFIETYNSSTRTRYVPGLTVITKIYEDKYGTGAFNEDVHRNRGLFRERMKELIGDAVPFALLLGTKLNFDLNESPVQPRPIQRPELIDVSQNKFLNEMLGDPNTSSFAKLLFAHILSENPKSEIYSSHGPGRIGTEQYKPELTPIHAFIARQIFPFVTTPATGDTLSIQNNIAMVRHDLDEIPLESWNPRGMSSAELVEFVQNQYFDWAVKQQTFIDKGINRDGTSGNLPSEEQVSARIEMARGAESVSRSMELLFPGQSAFVVAVADESAGNLVPIFKLLPARPMDSIESGTYRAPMQSHPIYTTDTIMKASLRAAVADLLRTNPKVLELFRRFGVPEFRIAHPLQSADYLDIPDDIQVTPPLFTDKSKEAMGGRRRLADLLKRAKLFTSNGGSETLDKQSVLGEQRQWPDFVRRVFGGPQSSRSTRIRNATSDIFDIHFLPGELLIGLDKGNDPSVMFGGNYSQGLGGYYMLGSGVVVLEPAALVVGAVNPVNVLQDIIDTSERANAAEGMGSGAIIFHEWVHYFHDMSLGEVQRILQKKMAALEAELIASGTSPKDARKQTRRTLRKLQRKLGVEYLTPMADKNRIEPGDPSYETYHHMRADQVGITLFDRNDPNDPRSSVPIRRRILDFTKFADYGYASEEEMEDDFLATHLALQESGYGPGEILYTLAAKTRRPMSLSDVRRERSKAAEAAKTSSQPWTRTSYGQGQPEERIPEASIGFFMEQFKNAPFMVNDAIIKLLTRLFMHRDKDGDLVEPHGITTLRRRRRSTRGFSDEYDVDTVDATSTVNAVSAKEKRTADGHRQGIRSRGRVGAAESRMMRFDPDERSRLRSGSSNIDIDTDERLYAFDEPITITDSRARARVYSIGDYRFYDNDVPYSQAIGPRRRQLSGYLSGRVYVNRNRAHDGDMIRAMSSTQFGMFVDDMPTYDTTSETDRMMLRGIVSGRIADLPVTTRNRIEVALRHATNIHSAIQGATPNKRELYRVVKADPLSFVEGIVVGEQIPFPITAFSDVRPPNNAGEVVLRIQRGAKAIDVEDGQFLSQGTFEVVALDMVGGQVVATLKHVETFDPRHDAMRPVDRFSDKPGAMRKFGTPNPRYTPSEQELMTVDLARRTDKAQIDKQMYGLRSTGATGLGVDMDNELEELSGFGASLTARTILAKMKDRIRQGIQKQTEKRLGVVRESIKQKYGSERPWLADADVLRRFASADAQSRRQVVFGIVGRALKELENNEQGIPSSVTWDSENKIYTYLIYPNAVQWDIPLLNHLIDNDELLLFKPGAMTSEDGQVVLLPDTVRARIKLVLTDEEKEHLRSIRDVLEVGSRAYLIDNDEGQKINLIKDSENVDDVIELSIKKSLARSHGAQYNMNRGSLLMTSGSPYTDESFAFRGDVHTDSDLRNRRQAVSERWGRFQRDIRFKDGEIMVTHGSMDIDKSIKGTATLLNQHSWLWWQQIPGTRVSLTAADDGPLVWSRHGFSQVNDDKVDYARLINVVSYIIGATSSNQSTRKRAAKSNRDLGFGVNHDGLFQTPILNDDGQIAESDTRLRERLAVWLALAIQDRESTDITDRPKRQGSMVLLANLLDASDMSPAQKEEWKQLFLSFNDESGKYQIQLDGSDNESDFIPSMVIDIDDPFSRRVERQIIASEARDAGERQDLLMPDRRVEDDKEAEFSKFQQRNRSVRPLPQDDDDVSVEDNSSNQRISRLSSIAESAIFESGVDSPSRDSEATMTLQTRVAREVAGYDALPPLFTLRDAESEMPSAQNYGDATPRINYRDIRTGTNTVILVGIPQSGGRQHDVQEMTGAIRNFVRGNRPSEWDSDNLIWKGDMVFTTTPGEYIHRLGNQADDKLMALGVSKPNSKWIRRAELHDIASTLNSILDRLPSLRHSRHNDDRLFSITGQGVFVDNPFRDNARYILDKEVFDSILEEYHPDLSNDAKDSIFSVLSSFGDILSLQASRDEVEARRGDNLYDWLLQLTTEDTSSDSDSRRRQLLATILGYDFLDETKFGETRTNIVVLNRSRMKMVDESVSALEVSRATKLPVTPRNPRSLRSSGVAANIMSGDDGEPTLLRMYGEDVPDPLGLTPAQLHSQKYERILRQDYGVDTPQRPSLRSGGSLDTERAKTKKWRAKREKAREGTPSLGDFDVFKQKIASSVQRHRELTEEIEALDEKIAEIEERQMDLSDSNSLSAEEDLEFENELDGLNAQNEALRREKLTIADTVASEVNSFNMAMSDNEENSSAMMAIRNFLDDEVSGNIPLEYRERLEAMHSTLERISTAAPSVQEMKRRHKILQTILDDDGDFDLRYDVTRESGYDDTYIEGADLEDFSLDELDEDSYAVNHWVEWVYRAFFDPDYSEWSTRSRESNIGNLAETLANFLGQPSEPYRREKTTRGRLEDLIDLAVAGITSDERRTWSRSHEDSLRERFNASYEEAIIDATPSSSSEVPSGVPSGVWRKIIASARLAKRTPYEGERDAALATAKRLLGKHRPDLADDDYVMGLRSRGRTGRQLPTIKGVNLRNSEPVTRGASPEVLRTPKGERFHSRLLERLTPYGVKEEDLMPDGKYGKLFTLLFEENAGQSLDLLERRIRNPTDVVDADGTDIQPWYDFLNKSLSDEDMTVMLEILKESAKLAQQMGFSITPIEGHVVKKINGPIVEDVADVLMDEVDIAMIRALGAPTFARLIGIQASYARKLHQLNKMFGAYEVDDDGEPRTSASGFGRMTSAYRIFLDDGAQRSRRQNGRVEYFDQSGNLVMTVAEQKAVRFWQTIGDAETLEMVNARPAMSPRTLILTLGRTEGGPADETGWLAHGPTNNAIAEAMLEAVGVSHTVTAGRANLDTSPGLQMIGGPEGSGTLNAARERLRLARETAEAIEFSPTPAGRHMEEMARREIQRQEIVIDTYERMGRRYVQIIRESGVSEDELAGRVTQLLDTVSTSDGKFRNQHPVGENYGASMFEQALFAWLNMRLSSNGVPKITDLDNSVSGLHEIGHFILGQAFTRHGEFASNFWSFAVNGPSSWRTFTEIQSGQSGNFDTMTIREATGRKYTPEQSELFKSLNAQTRDVLENLGLVTNEGGRINRGQTLGDVRRMQQGVIDAISADPSIDAVEKEELLIALGKNSVELSSATGLRNPTSSNWWRTARQADLTDEVLRVLGIPNFDLDETRFEDEELFTDDAPVGRLTRVGDLYDALIPLDAKDFGWQRTPASSSSLRSSGAPSNTVKRKYRGDYEEIIRLVGEGLNTTEIASRLGQNVRNVAAKIKRLRKDGRVGNVTRKVRQDDDLTINRRIAKAKRLDAYIQYHQNLINGMSRTEAINALLEAMDKEDFRVIAERGTRETRQIRLEKISELLETVNAGLPDFAMLGTRGPLTNENDYILINEMKIFGFSIRETAEQLRLSVTTVNRYRRMHYRAYSESKEPQTLRSSGATPDIRARVRDYVQSVAAVDGPAYEPLYALLSSDDNANFSNNSQIARVFRKLVDQIEETLRVDGNENQTLIPMDNEGLEKLAEKLFKRVLKTSRTPRAVFTDDLRQGLAEFIGLRTADHRDRRSRFEAGAGFLSTTARETLRSSGSLRSVGEPSRRETPLSDKTRQELGRVGRNANSARIALGDVDITVKRERDFTDEEFDNVNRLLDVYERRLEKAQEMLEDQREQLQDQKMTLDVSVDAGKASDRQYLRLNIIEEELDELDRKEEILNRGQEANRLSYLMMNQLRRNSLTPRPDQYDNKYIIIKNADGTIAGMSMWGFLEVDVTFNAPDVEWNGYDATSLPPDDRITGRMTYIDFVISFQNVPGMGSLLFQKALEDAKGQNGRKVFLETTDSSLGYWERLGFRQRRIAGSTSEYYELVGRIDEMHEATNVQEV